jgi:hypothetical protein
LNKPIWFVGNWELRYPVLIVWTKGNKGQGKGWRWPSHCKHCWYTFVHQFIVTLYEHEVVMLHEICIYNPWYDATWSPKTWIIYDELKCIEAWRIEPSHWWGGSYLYSMVNKCNLGQSFSHSLEFDLEL